MSTPAAPPPAPADRDASADVAAFYQRADALARCAAECCRQHERLAHLHKIGALAAELRAGQTLVAICDEALAELSASYERAAERVRSARGDARGDARWHASNGLWLASREFARRTATTTRAGRNMGDQGERARFEELALDYDLEASSLLLLKQATEAYRRARPEAA